MTTPRIEDMARKFATDWENWQATLTTSGKKPTLYELTLKLLTTLTDKVGEEERKLGDEDYEELRQKLLIYMDFVDEMAVDTPFDVAFESLNKKLQTLTNTTK